jgi:hypothetical protein
MAFVWCAWSADVSKNTDEVDHHSDDDSVSMQEIEN